MGKKHSHLLKTAIFLVGLLGLAPLASAAGFYYGKTWYPSQAAFCSLAWAHNLPVCINAGYSYGHVGYYGYPSGNYYYNNYHSGYSNVYNYPNYTKYNGPHGGHYYTSPRGNVYAHPYNYNAHPGYGHKSVGKTNIYYGHGHAVAHR
ncbi:MAG TPA: hypothetical protein VHE99_09385 [Gammaproteobacteria bacterium]|nr:hypothetical protein [Gammaproteobacteria bacterium]